MVLPQLKLVGIETENVRNTRGAASAPSGAQLGQAAVQRVFDHWVYMLGKNPRRTALGPDRRKAIQRALSLYDEETILLAIEGCAADPWHRGENDRQREFADLCLILRDEAHIERFAADGEALRERLAREQQREQARRQQATQAPADEQVTAEQVQAQREALRALAARRTGRTA